MRCDIMLSGIFRTLFILVTAATALAFFAGCSGAMLAQNARNSNSPTPTATAPVEIAVNTVPMATPTPRKVAQGTWGGQGIRFDVSSESVQIEFDCAHGEIPSPPALDSKGSFTVEGTLTREPFGPIRMDRMPQPAKAIYKGHVADKGMDLKVTLVEGDRDAGSFTLTFGQQGRLHKCK